MKEHEHAAKNKPETKPAHDEVAKKAYAIYLKEGRPQVHDVENWLEAEAQMPHAKPDHPDHQDHHAHMAVDDKVLIKPGEKIPADGVIVEGESSVNEAMLTGESTPVTKETGGKVIGGAINGEGSSRRTEMTAESHNAPQHNLHANQAGSAGDCTSSAHSSLPWRRLVRFFATTVLASFVLNEIWEMAQMSAYVETAGHSWTSTLALCTRAAVGDLGIILGIYAAVALVAGDLGWGLRGRWNVYATAALLGLAYAALEEHAALDAGRWSYTERMPVVSVLGSGLWPLLQMTLLPPLTFLFARWWAGRSATKGAS